MELGIGVGTMPGVAVDSGVMSTFGVGVSVGVMSGSGAGVSVGFAVGMGVIVGAAATVGEKVVDGRGVCVGDVVVLSIGLGEGAGRGGLEVRGSALSAGGGAVVMLEGDRGVAEGIASGVRLAAAGATFGVEAAVGGIVVASSPTHVVVVNSTIAARSAITVCRSSHLDSRSLPRSRRLVADNPVQHIIRVPVVD